jgi:hypothetical protein
MRNPFSVPDVPDPTGPDVEQFAKELPLGDPALDENAIAWVITATKADGLAGAWSSRWRDGQTSWHQGVATLVLEPDRAFILYRDAGTYLIEAERRGDRLVGRYVNLERAHDTSPWIGLIVDDYRIDGYWARGRWDLRRCSPDEQPEPILAGLMTEAKQLPAAELRELLGFARYLRWRRNS